MQATINGMTMSYDDCGTGPAVVLLHDFPLCRHQWKPQVVPLVDAGYRVITPDLRGFGESELASPLYSMETLADDIAGLLGYLGIGRAVVIGMSMGGYVLLSLLERHPQRLAAAAFVAGRCRADNVEEKSRRTQQLALLQAGKREEFLRQWCDSLLAGAAPEARLLLEPQLRAMMNSTDARGLMAGLVAQRDRRDYTARIRQVDLPALVISIDRDPVVDPEHSRYLAAALPGSSRRGLSGCSHLVNLELPEEFNRCLLDFLHGLSRFRSCRLPMQNVA